ncbi:unnamed protein product [Rotaria socialis]|uniref:Uncharacterized protein n=3 Tax=Rotaria socialis TaxID=392032 RepID=A0A821EB60_9BILA|nr:unnamed protein product [Rotaria socialis]CAF3657985.1 unnamed protein product [Rotaria socialis]CAF3672399.1 unnamed protein product [Rotaria socialis]CAF3809336.1 unnamed protein product [Rotaria socialis]CAF4306248.1 unnamed protein product [Rotaria socialis]
MMQSIRISLIFLHITIILCAIIRLHPYLTNLANTSKSGKQISLIVGFVINSIYILLYHTASILAVLYTDYNADIVRASGILLIGELLQIIHSIVEYTMEVDHVGGGQLFCLIMFATLLSITIFVTFKLSEKIFKEHNNLIQLKTLTDSVNGILMDTDNKPSRF